MIGRKSDGGREARPPDERAGWMAAAQKGDAAAYESLLASLLAPLRSFVRRRGVEATEVEDVVQDILLLIHRARHTWRDDQPFDPWMWAIARNASTDALRRQSRLRARREHGSDRSTARVDETTHELPSDPEAQLAAEELSPALADALAGLPETQRQAVKLLYVEQLSVTEAAARAGVSPGALKVRAHRGSRALRDALRKEGGP